MAKQIIITQPQPLLVETSEEWGETGFLLRGVPFIQTQPVSFQRPGFSEWDWVFFTSRAAVAHFFETMSQEELSHWQALGRVPKVAVVGPKTQEVLLSMGIPVAFVSPQFTAMAAAEAFVAHLWGTQDMESLGILWPCGTSALPDLMAGLQSKGIHRVLRLPVYQTVPITLSAQGRQLCQIVLAQSDAVVFTSPSNVTSWCKNHLQIPPTARLVALGPSTHKTLQVQGLSQGLATEILTAMPHTVEGALSVLAKAWGLVRPKRHSSSPVLFLNLKEKP